MPSDKVLHASASAPATDSRTLAELLRWIRRDSGVSREHAGQLVEAVDQVFARHERCGSSRSRKRFRRCPPALPIACAGCARNWRHAKPPSAASPGTSRQLVADLTDASHRDPKTRLMNFRRFIEQLESFLALEQRGRWCAVGLVDITSFKWYNDTLGHAARRPHHRPRRAAAARAGPVRRPDGPGAAERWTPRNCTPGSAATSSAS